MDNGIEDATLKRTKIEYLEFLKRLDTARIHYEASNNKSPKLLEEIKFYEIEIKNFGERLRKHGIPPESLFSKKRGNPRTIEISQQYPNDVICQTC